MVHQQSHVIQNTAHRPSTQAGYTASRLRPKRKISCAAAQIAATLTISFPWWRHMSLTSYWGQKRTSLMSYPGQLYLNSIDKAMHIPWIHPTLHVLVPSCTWYIPVHAPNTPMSVPRLAPCWHFIALYFIVLQKCVHFNFFHQEHRTTGGSRCSTAPPAKESSIRVRLFFIFIPSSSSWFNWVGSRVANSIKLNLLTNN